MNKGFTKFEAYLREHGLKMTRARELVFREILSSPGVHPNAEEIHRRLRAKKKPVGLATIYRTLNLLVRSGLVTAIDLGESHSHFEPDWNRISHGHLICLSCGRVQEFSHAEIQAAINRIGEEKGYLLDKFSIQVFGYCKDCTANRRRAEKS
ncbi:MAG: Fur family transcriptional regulator [Candidatus Aminicenantales bacterium]